MYAHGLPKFSTDTFEPFNRTRKTSRRRSNNLTSKACESEDNVPEIENVKVPACPVVTEPPNEDGPSQVKLSATMGSQGEAEEKGDAR